MQLCDRSNNAAAPPLWCSTLWGGSGPCNFVCARSLTFKSWQLAEMGMHYRHRALVWCSWSWLVQHNRRQKLPKLPEHHWWNAGLSNGLSEDCVMMILNSLACVLFPLCLIEGLMPLELDLGWGKDVDWLVQRQQQQPSPCSPIDAPSFFPFVLAEERIGAHNHSKG